jgi:enoyl-CoA hydratase/carnithine racemase
MEAELTELSPALEVARGLHRRCSADGRIERWELHNPERRNAVTPAALRWIAQRCAALDGEVVVLGSSAGPFCSGFDLKALASALANDDDPLPDQVLIDATAAMRRAEAVFVGAVRRYAIGAGVELLACCDLRVMSEDSFIEIPAARLGVVYHADGIQRIRAVFGGQIATRLLVVADRVRAEELFAVGALSEVVDEPRVEEQALALARTILNLDARAVAQNLGLIRASDDGSLDELTRATHERARKAAYARARAAKVESAGSEN